MSNYNERFVSGNEIPLYSKDHTNSLNFNITTGLIETGMEALKIYNGKMDDGEPYKLFNRTGYLLELRDVKKQDTSRTVGENVAIEWKDRSDLFFLEKAGIGQREGG